MVELFPNVIETELIQDRLLAFLPFREAYRLGIVFVAHLAQAFDFVLRRPRGTAAFDLNQSVMGSTYLA